jgi:AcrR family transcriptional regulator
MSVVTLRDRRSERNAATRREILDAAWEIVRTEGLAVLSMRELGARVGMRAQSLYVYFPSKHAIYDAMFGEANRQLLSRLADLDDDVEDPAQRLGSRARVFVDFCVEDPVRYQLLFQRTIPGFEPSPESYAPALEVLDNGRSALRAAGVDDPSAVDVWTAITGGLGAQQNANEPGGDRWVRLVDQVTDMYLDYFGNTMVRRER